MNPFDREDDILCAKRFSEDVTVSPPLTPEAQFQQWLDTLKPTTCVSHTRTAMVLDREWSKDGVNYSPIRDAKADRYEFRAVLCCPACKVEYAQAPPEFWESSFEGFQTPTQELATNLARCREFAAQVNEHKRGFMLLSGFNGNGKTRLACNIIREVDCADCLYLTLGQFTLIHRRTYAQRLHFLAPRRGYDDDESKAPALPKTIWELCQEIRGVLVLDEIGAKALSPDEMLILDEVLKHRYDHWKPTVLASNLVLSGTPDKPGLKEFLGDALADRIRYAAGKGKFILQFSGESFRRGGGDDYLSGLP
jgi:hypothetical protein